MRSYDLVLSFGWGAIDGVITQRLFGLLMGLPPLVHHEDGSHLDAVGPLGFGSDIYRRYSLAAARASSCRPDASLISRSTSGMSPLAM